MKVIVNEKTPGYNLDMIEVGPDVSLKSSAQSIWHWMWVCLLFVVPALLCIGEPLTFIMVTPIFGWIPFVFQAVAWKTTHTLVKRYKWQRFLSLLIPIISACFLLFKLSFFYGRPREIIGMALKDNPPLVFWPVEFKEDGWTDYTARLRVHLDKDYLRNALEKHFERRQFLDGMPHEYYRKDLAGVEGAICIVETDAQFSYAKITYGVD